ncbi:MAG: type 1 glutamine amidotransferase [Actinomycetota bacterium]|nr:type 1 glutamine amidotransferase [Actinomycetota bacterium]
MRALAIIHQLDAGPGVFADEAANRGWGLDEWVLPSGDPPPADPHTYDAVLAFGGAMHADQEAENPWLREEKQLLARLLTSGVPVMGVCLGSQLLAESAGAPAVRASEPEIGWLDVEVTAEGADDRVIGDLAPGFEALQWHSYRSPLPRGAVELAQSPVSLQAYRLGERAWGIQFHAEVSEVDAVSWAVNYAVDPDAVRIGIDPDLLSAQILERIGEWNALGRGICGRFLDVAAAA